MHLKNQSPERSLDFKILKYWRESEYRKLAKGTGRRDSGTQGKLI
jgi:hypothetical protein